MKYNTSVYQHTQYSSACVPVYRLVCTMYAGLHARQRGPKEGGGGDGW